MHKNRWQLLLLFLMLLAGLEPMPAAAVTKPLPQAAAKIQPFLTALAATDPADVVALIVQKQDQTTDAEAVVIAAGGQITKRFPLINAFAAQAPARVVSALATTAAVRWVALDAPVITAAATDWMATDDFDTVAYNGSNGSYAWAGDWQEIGESDGAALGDVAVTPFWGGALQGLRLQGAAKGIVRPIDLTAAAGSRLTLSYRRKGFTSDADYISVELSGDGGAHWQAIGRLTGPVTDAAIQSVQYEITAYQSPATLLRLTTAPALGAMAKFYLDYVAVELTPAASQTPSAAHALYLPLVNKEDDLSSTYDKTVALADKRALLVRAAQTDGEPCTWQCIDRTKLASTYVKAIGADQLWNSAPYLRGQGVTVAVVDSGIAHHADLNDYAGQSRLLQQVNFVQDEMLPDDYYGHGTHVAGAIAGLGQASAGVYLGVAPEAQLLDVRVMNDRGHGNTSSVIEGLQWVYDQRAQYNIRVVNLSLNSRIPESYHTSALNAALEVLWFNNIVAVVSAGNGGKQRLYPPANDPFVLTIGSADDKGTVSLADDTLSTFSAYGMTADGFLKPDLVAPGGNIVSLLASDDSNLLAAFPNNKVVAPNHSIYFKLSGTSMASAVAAGAVALLLEDEPTLTPDQVKYRLLATARPFTGPESCATGAGYLDLYGAVHGVTTASANTGLAASQLLWDGLAPTLWGSVSWNSVSWNSVSWNSVSWNSVSWNSVSWNSVSWNSNDNGSGAGGGSCVSAIAGLTLVNQETGAALQPLYDGAVVNLDALPTTNLSVQAEVAGQVESVKFGLSGSAVITQVQNSAPYRLGNDVNLYSGGLTAATGRSSSSPAPALNGMTGATLGVGIYQLKVGAFGQDNAGGAPGGQMDLEFVIADATRCTVENLVRPTRSTTPVALQVENQSSEPVALWSIDANGQRISAGIIAPNTTQTATTFATHPWVLTRTTDQSCLYLIPDAGDEPALVYFGAGNAVTTAPVYIYEDDAAVNGDDATIDPPDTLPPPDAPVAVFGK